MLRASLARRFIVFISLLILATSLTLSLFMLAHEHRAYDKHIRQRGVSLARNLAYNAELGVLTRNAAILRELAEGILRESDVVAVSVTDAAGRVLMEETASDANPDGLIATSEVLAHEGEDAQAAITRFTRPHSERVEAYQFIFPVHTRRGERHDEEIGFLLADDDGPARLEAIGHVRVMLSLTDLYRDRAALTGALGLLTFLVIAVAVLLTVMLVQRMVAPLRALAAATRHIAEGSLGEVAVEASRDEIGQLAKSFNRMTSQLRRSRQELERYSAGLEEQVRLRTEELEAAQSQLVQAEKISAIGLLVSGVAHELNNPLTGVIGLSQLSLMSDMDEKLRSDLETINREAVRCKKIIQNLQTFARKHKPQKDYLGINGIVESTLELQSYQLKLDGIRVVRKLDPDLPKTMVDFHQLQRVFLNIIINAHQALAADGEGGQLFLTTSCRDGRIVIEIEDTGPGVAPEDVGKLFDPFFTTKEVGQGTGLGLSICYGIVEEHNGRLWAGTGAAGGALFTVELPIIECQPRADDGPEEVARPPARNPARKSILVVDDEMGIIEILLQVLSADGHSVDTALNGAMAWQKIQNQPYDLIISDLRMPEMNGQELYARVRDWDQPLSKRIIFSTGDVLNRDTHQFLIDSGNIFLQKPFELEAIRKAIEDAFEVDAR